MHSINKYYNHSKNDPSIHILSPLGTLAVRHRCWSHIHLRNTGRRCGRASRLVDHQLNRRNCWCRVRRHSNLVRLRGLENHFKPARKQTYLRNHQNYTKNKSTSTNDNPCLLLSIHIVTYTILLNHSDRSNNLMHINIRPGRNEICA